MRFSLRQATFMCVPSLRQMKRGRSPFQATPPDCDGGSASLPCRPRSFSDSTPLRGFLAGCMPCPALRWGLSVARRQPAGG